MQEARERNINNLQCCLFIIALYEGTVQPRQCCFRRSMMYNLQRGKGYVRRILYTNCRKHIKQTICRSEKTYICGHQHNPSYCSGLRPKASFLIFCLSFCNRQTDQRNQVDQNRIFPVPKNSRASYKPVKFSRWIAMYTTKCQEML